MTWYLVRRLAAYWLIRISIVAVGVLAAIVAGQQS